MNSISRPFSHHQHIYTNTYTVQSTQLGRTQKNFWLKLFFFCCKNWNNKTRMYVKCIKSKCVPQINPLLENSNSTGKYLLKFESNTKLCKCMGIFPTLQQKCIRKMYQINTHTHTPNEHKIPRYNTPLSPPKKTYIYV